MSEDRAGYVYPEPTSAPIQRGKPWPFEVPPDDRDTRDRFEEILQEMVETHRAKKHDYGDSLWAVKALGVTPLLGIFVRMSDKWSRVTTLHVHGGEMVKSETIKDTLLDLAAYAILAVVELEKDE